MMRIARVEAQAKVNLLLRVLARESSGYHSLETVFLRLALSDAVTVRVGDGVRERSVECLGDAMPATGLGAPERNLAFRAGAAYADAAGWPAEFAIEVVKRIPVGGGLGGGSADAGAVLRALDAMSPNPLGERLPEVGLALGADVPFMTLDSPMALAWGRGERLLPVTALLPRPVLLVVPDFGVSTEAAYGWLSAERGEYAPRADVLSLSDLDTWEGIAARATNDFEPVVTRRHSELAKYVDALEASGAVIAMMSGSGSVVFGVFDTDAQAAAAADALESASGGRARIVITRTADRVERVEAG